MLKHKTFNKIVFVVNNLDFLFSHRRRLVEKIEQICGCVTIIAPKTSKEANIGHLRRIYLPLNRQGLNPWIFLKTQLRIWKFVLDNPDAVFHLITIIPILHFGLVLTVLNRNAVYALSGMGTVFTDDNFKTRVIKYIVAKFYLLIFKSKKTRIIVQNNDDRNFLINLGVDDFKINKIRGSGVNLNDYEFAPKLSLNNPPVILLPARLIREKGIYDAIGASVLLIKGNVPHRLTIAGDNNTDNPSAISLAEQRQIEQNNPQIKFIGHQKDMKSVYQASDLVCLPSYREGLPKTIIEAFAIGRLCIAYNAIGVREIVIHQKNGILADYKNIESLAFWLKEALQNYQKFEPYLKAARLDAETHFSEELVVNKHIETYQAFETSS